MYNTAQMDYMKTELEDMIRFYQYDGSSQEGDVETNFFDLEPIQTDQMNEKRTFSHYN